MPEGRCPLCQAVLSFPPGPHHARTYLDTLTNHFGHACPAIRIPRS